jgi:ATP-dependent Clp protease ATP-binding subunit ClpC
VFHQLTQDEVLRIVDLRIAELDVRLKDKDMGLEPTQAAKELLAKHGFDPVLGARPLRRTIQREIEDTLSEKILFGELKAGEIVLVDVEGEGPEAKFTFTGSPKSELDTEVAAPVAAGAASGTAAAPKREKTT